MIRRNARLRKEYLYRKSLEGKDKAAYERKRALRQALESGRPLPTELRRDAAALKREAELEDDNTAAPRDHVDDEYGRAGERDPKVLITTSRDPSSRLVQFAKEMRLVVPNAQRLNRGGMLLSELVEAGRSHDFTDVVVLHEHRGEPGERIAQSRAAQRQGSGIAARSSSARGTRLVVSFGRGFELGFCAVTLAA